MAAMAAVGVDEEMEMAAEGVDHLEVPVDQAEGGDARPAMAAMAAVGVDEEMEVAAEGVEHLEVPVDQAEFAEHEGDEAEGGEPAPRAQRESKNKGIEALRSTMALVNVQDRIDKKYKSEYGKFPPFKYNSKIRKAAFNEFTDDPFLP